MKCTVLKTEGGGKRITLLLAEPNAQMSADEIEKAAHRFVMRMPRQCVINGRSLVESMVAPEGYKVDGRLVKGGSWIVVLRDDNISASLAKTLDCSDLVEATLNELTVSKSTTSDGTPSTGNWRLDAADAITKHAQSLIADFRTVNQFDEKSIEDRIATLQSADKKARAAAINSDLSDDDAREVFNAALHDIERWININLANAVSKGDTTMEKSEQQKQIRTLAEDAQRACDQVRMEYEDMHGQSPYDPSKKATPYMPAPNTALIDSLREHHRLLGRVATGEASDEPQLQMEIITQARVVREAVRAQGMADLNTATRYREHVISRGLEDGQRTSDPDEEREERKRPHHQREFSVGPRIESAPRGEDHDDEPEKEYHA